VEAYWNLETFLRRSGGTRKRGGLSKSHLPQSQHPVPFVALGRLHQKAGRLRKRLSPIVRFRRKPDDPRVWYDLGMSPSRSDITRSGRCLRQGLQLDPERRFLFNLGLSLVLWASQDALAVLAELGSRIPSWRDGCGRRSSGLFGTIGIPPERRDRSSRLTSSEVIGKISLHCAHPLCRKGGSRTGSAVTAVPTSGRAAILAAALVAMTVTPICPHQGGLHLDDDRYVTTRTVAQRRRAAADLVRASAFPQYYPLS